MTTITIKIVGGFVPNCMGRFLGEREVRVSLRSVEDVEVTVKDNYTYRKKIRFRGELYSLILEYFPSSFESQASFTRVCIGRRVLDEIISHLFTSAQSLGCRVLHNYWQLGIS